MGEAHLQVDYIAKLTNQTSLPTYQQSVNPVLISHEYDNGLQIVMVVCGITVHHFILTPVVEALCTPAGL